MLTQEYITLFNTITTTIEELHRIEEALKEAQIQSEEIVVSCK